MPVVPVTLDLDWTMGVRLDELTPLLRFGDGLLYSSNGFWGHAIKLKTWSDVSHIEMYLAQEKTAGSREGTGVRTYDFTTKNLAYIIRTTEVIDVAGVMAYHQSCVGQAYDMWGLMRFFTFGKQSTDKQFCSEYFTRLCRNGKLNPFDRRYDADLISPGMYHMSPHFDHIYAVRKLKGTRLAFPVLAV